MNEDGRAIHAEKRKSYFNGGIYLIANADWGLETTELKRAIEELQAIIIVRENVPF